MTHIVIIFTRTQQELSQALNESVLNSWLDIADKEALGTKNFWSKLNKILDLSQKPDPQVLNLSPVKVELGMRDSQCHTLLEKNAVISQNQIAEFNRFFSGVFNLIKLDTGNYQLHFQQFLKFNLPIEHWPPHLTDYRVQIEASGNSLKSHLTEMQSWCYQQDSLWNAFYLWSQPKDSVLEKINLDDRSKTKSISKLNIFNEANAHAELKVIIIDELSSLAYDLMKMEQLFKDAKLKKLTLSFPDENVYHLTPRDFYPWWKKIFSK